MGFNGQTMPEKEIFVTGAEIFLFSKNFYAVYAGGNVLCGNKTILICSRQLLAGHAEAPKRAPEALTALCGERKPTKMCPPGAQWAR